MRHFLTLAASASLALGALPALAQDADTNPPWSQADAYYDPEEMSKARRDVMEGSGHQTNWFVQADRFETRFGDDEDAGVWDAQAWYGGDINKLWIKTEGDYSFEADEIEDAEIQALWSRAISPYFDLQTGVRYDFEPGGRTHAVFGVQGLAPYWYEVDGAAFISTDGDVTARFEVEYEWLLSQRLILQPRAEINLSAQDIPELQIGSGITDVEAGLRLRYEFVREFAPYVGVAWQSSFGDTADMIEAAGEDTDRAVFLLGIRAWY